jgi:type VI secretion system protein ImpK
MTPEFAKAVDPVFLRVLRLQERIAAGENPSPPDEAAHIRGFLDQAESAIGQSPEWTLAKYALVAWVDEMLVDPVWEGGDWWKNNTLEQELFRSRQRYHEFYQRAKEAHTRGYFNSLEVYYVCVVLGFRGLYAGLDIEHQAEEMELPPTVERWAQQMAMAIRGSPRPPIHSGGAVGPGAPPLTGQALFIGSSMLAAALGALLVGAIFILK